MVIIANNNEEGIKCPICGAKTVYANVLTTMSFLSKHYVCNDGLGYNYDTMRDIIGEPAHEPIMKCTKFSCDTCKNIWTNREIKYSRDKETGLCKFTEMESTVEDIKAKNSKKTRGGNRK